MNIQITLVSVFLLFAACSGDKQDIHTMDREPKAYESVPVESMSQTELLGHLSVLADEMSLAAEKELYLEMHHLEIALTRAINALEPKVPSSAQSTLDTLKVVAVKIHGAGHDQNKSMAGTLNKTLQDQINRLRKILEIEK